MTVSVHLASLSLAHLATKPLQTRSADTFVVELTDLKTCKGTCYSYHRAIQKHAASSKC